MLLKLYFVSLIFTQCKLYVAQTEISQKFYKKMLFSSNSWANLVYTSVASEVRSDVECVSHCQMDSLQCNIFFFERTNKTCWLGTLGSNLTYLGPLNISMNGYIDLGKIN